MILLHPILPMNPELALANMVVSVRTAPTFAVRYSPEVPAYHELTLEDSCGTVIQWVISQPVKQLAKHPVLLWLLSAPTQLSSLSCLETGSVQSAAAQSGVASDLRTGLHQGLLRLTFSGKLLRGHYRLHCLPAGCGQLWQLTPIGCV